MLYQETLSLTKPTPKTSIVRRYTARVKILITGCAGFFGHNLAQALLENNVKNEVVGIDNFLSGKKEHLHNLLDHDRFQFLEGDCRDTALLNGLPKIDTIFHLAANSDIAAAMANPTIDYELGIQTTHSMLEFARLRSVKNLIFASGSGVYGEVPGQVFDEDSFVGQPTSTYGATKLASEALISAYSFMFDIKSTVFRFSNLVGKNQTHGVVFDFIHKLYRDPQILEVLGDGTQTKPYIHLTDAIEGMTIALKGQKKAFEVFNVSNSSSTSVSQIAELVVRELGTSSTKIEYGSTDRGWKADIPKYSMSSNKLKNLGWDPKMSSDQAICKSILENLK